jgi:hypothetical protein
LRGGEAAELKQGGLENNVVVESRLVEQAVNPGVA